MRTARSCDRSACHIARFMLQITQLHPGIRKFGRRFNHFFQPRLGIKKTSTSSIGQGCRLTCARGCPPLAQSVFPQGYITGPHAIASSDYQQRENREAGQCGTAHDLLTPEQITQRPPRNKNQSDAQLNRVVVRSQ